MEVPEAYTVTGVQEVGLTMFGEEEDEHTKNATSVEDIDAQHAHSQDLQNKNDNAADSVSGDNAELNDTENNSQPAAELTPVEKLLQAESKLSLYQQRLEQVRQQWCNQGDNASLLTVDTLTLCLRRRKLARMHW